MKILKQILFKKRQKLSTSILKMLRKSIPLWLAIFLTVDSIALGVLADQLIMRRQVNRLQRQLLEIKNPELLVKEVTAQVLPSGGYTTSLKWGDIGKKLVDSGAIDADKFKQIHKSNIDGQQDLDILDGNSNKFIAINENNSRLVVNLLWALGLVNKSKVLDEGPMKSGETDAGNFASTAGWTLGTKPAMELYSSQELIPLTPEQQELVKEIAENVYRPCCGNSTAFPDCNHGIAALAYIELAVANGLTENQIYKDILAMNSFWFPDTYVEMAVYFQKQQGLAWNKVDPKVALSKDYSSAQGAARINQAVQGVPGIQSRGGSCGA
ncbi:hypothetical protein HYU89_04865 [Candidatus Collierbacteria bacterium]|nr:hypothetical protein [Candidatus Collierbacteria bacterium]